jgi:hypothetical protein
MPEREIRRHSYFTSIPPAPPRASESDVIDVPRE